jgi:hypothetical protein
VGEECDTGQGQRVAAPGDRAGRRPPETDRDQGDEHRRGADDEGGVGHAGALDAEVLEHGHRAEAERAGGADARHERAAKLAARDDGEQRRGRGEADDGEPARPEPLQRDLGERHGQAPEHAGGGECEDGCAARFHEEHCRLVRDVRHS